MSGFSLGDWNTMGVGAGGGMPVMGPGAYAGMAGYTPQTIPVAGATPAVQMPGVGGMTGPGGMMNPGATGLGWNIGTGQLALGALGAGANIWQAWNANQMATKTFNLQRDLANTNLRNQIQSYNTALEDRARARAVTEGQSDAERQAYVDRNRLSR